MARAAVKTLLPLDRFAAVLNIHPLHFNQVFLSGLPDQPDNTSARTCDVPIFQYSWQANGKIGRDDIAQAIAAAESMIIPRLGYLPVPDWTVQEEKRAVRPANPVLTSYNDLDPRGYYKTVQARYGQIISGGQQAKTLIDDGVAITYSDTDADGFDNRAEITFNTSVADPEEIAVYYPGHSGDDAWQIKPLSYISIVAGVATVRFNRQQAIVEAQMEGYFPTGINGTQDDQFLTTVDVYRKYNDPSVQSRFIWDVVGGNWCGQCDGLTPCEVCGYAIQNGCLVVRNPRLGIVSPQPGSWDADTGEFTAAQFSVWREADRVQLWYKSGWRDNSLPYPNITMDPVFERAIAYLAASLLDRPMCNCQPVEANIARWREDLALSTSSPQGSSSFRLSQGALDNPFGTTRGAIYAWEIVRERMLGQAASDS